MVLCGQEIVIRLIPLELIIMLLTTLNGCVGNITLVVIWWLFTMRPRTPFCLDGVAITGSTCKRLEVNGIRLEERKSHISTGLLAFKIINLTIARLTCLVQMGIGIQPIRMYPLHHNVREEIVTLIKFLFCHYVGCVILIGSASTHQHQSEVSEKFCAMEKAYQLHVDVYQTHNTISNSKIILNMKVI